MTRILKYLSYLSIYLYIVCACVGACVRVCVPPGNPCNKLGVGDGDQYQVIVTSDVAMAVGKVFANPPQRCPTGSKFNQDACACVYQPILPDVARELPTPSESLMEGLGECRHVC